MKLNNELKRVLINLAYDGYTLNDAIDFVARCYCENLNMQTINAAKQVKDFK